MGRRIMISVPDFPAAGTQQVRQLHSQNGRVLLHSLQRHLDLRVEVWHPRREQIFEVRSSLSYNCVVLAGENKYAKCVPSWHPRREQVNEVRS